MIGQNSASISEEEIDQKRRELVAAFDSGAMILVADNGGAKSFMNAYGISASEIAHRIAMLSASIKDFSDRCREMIRSSYGEDAAKTFDQAVNQKVDLAEDLSKRREQIVPAQRGLPN